MAARCSWTKSAKALLPCRDVEAQAPARWAHADPGVELNRFVRGETFGSRPSQDRASQEERMTNPQHLVRRLTVLVSMTSLLLPL